MNADYQDFEYKENKYLRVSAPLALRTRIAGRSAKICVLIKQISRIGRKEL